MGDESNGYYYSTPVLYLLPLLNICGFFSVCLCVHDIHAFHYSILFCDIHPSQCICLCCSHCLFHSGLIHENRYSELLQWSNRVGRCISSWQEKGELAAVWANLGRQGVGLWDFVLTSDQSWAPIVPNMDMGYGILEPTTLVIIYLVVKFSWILLVSGLNTDRIR